jgi:hypothetical protein
VGAPSFADVVVSAVALALTRQASNERRPSFSIGRRPTMRRRRLRAWTASLLATAVFIPGTSAAVAIALFLHPVSEVNSPERAYVFGTLFGLFAWATFFAVVAWRFAWADRANPAVYNILCEAFDGLHTRLESAGPEDSGPAHREASHHLTRLGRGLGLYDDGPAPSVGLSWTLGVGYVDLWRNAHRADEALLHAAGEEALVGGAVFDDLRLDGSQIAGAADLRQKLRIALAVLSVNGEIFLNRPPSTPGEEPIMDRPPSRAAALGVLKIVRRTINEYRDDRRDGLVRVRNNLYATMIFASVMAYALFGVLMIGVLENDEQSRTAIEAGTVFYLSAAVIGLVRELHVVLSSHGVEEDYGLRTARLINIPLFSGLAGLAGVALIALLPATLPETEGATRQIDLRSVFDLEATPENLVVAAVFGLTPTLLIRGLQRRAEQYKEDLKTTEAGERPTQQTA